MATVANVTLADTFDQQRIKINQTIKIVNDVETMTHPLANLAGYASNTANAVANSAGNLAYSLITSNTFFMNQLTDYANANVTLLISTVYTDIYNDSNASFLRSNTALAQSNIARNQSNTAMNSANLAYDTANNFVSNANVIASGLYSTVYDIANNSFNTANNFVANSSNIVANLILSNTSTQNTLNLVVSQYIEDYLETVSFEVYFNKTNSAFVQANTAYDQANLALGRANSAGSVGNNAILIANAAFEQANVGVNQSTNTIFGILNTAFNTANAGFGQGNTAYSQANLAFNAANNAGTYANTVFDRTNTAFVQANTARLQANTAFDRANTANAIAVAAFNFANTSGGGANVAIINDTTTNNDNFFLTMARQTTGNATNLTVSSSKAYFNPSTGTLSATVFNSLSDENMKDHIQIVENALDLLEKLDGVEFTWKESGIRSAGVIAQNLINVVPHLVRCHEVATDETKENTKQELTVNYNGLTALFIESIKELNKEVKAIKSHLGM